MERYLQAADATTTCTFQEDGVTVDPGTVTVTIAREDGTVIATAQATGGTGAAARTFNLTAATYTAALDVLKLTWHSTTKGDRITYAEIVGGFLFTISEARALNPLGDTGLYPTSEIIRWRTLAEVALEDACGVAFVPRYFRTRVDGSGGDTILLPSRPLTITSVTVGASTASAGTTLTADELTDLELYESGEVWRSACWTAGRRNVRVKGTRGYLAPPGLVGEAALQIAKRFLVDSPLSDRATSLTNDDGTTQFFVTAGVRQAVFDIPLANSIVNEYGVGHGVG